MSGLTATGMGDDMAALNALVHRWTGVELTGAEFLACDALACGRCGTVRATAVVSTDWDGEAFGRRCVDCLRAEL